MGNLSEVEENEVNLPYVSDPNDPCSTPPSEGEINVLDSPLDTIGVIIEFLSEGRDILSLKNSCKMFSDFFRNEEMMEKVSFTLNFNRKIRKKVRFIYKLRCLAYYAEKLSNKHFYYFPNLLRLEIERCDEYNNISSQIFKYLPNLEEFRVKGGIFRINNDCKNLSRKIRVLSIRNSKTYQREKLRNDPKCNFLVDVLLNRPSLREIELWRIDIRPNDADFPIKINQLKNLKILIIRNCWVNDFPFNVQEGLEILDFENISRHSDEEAFIIPKSLKKLNIAGMMNFGSYLECLSKRAELYENVTYLNISDQNLDGGGLEIITKVFPNLKYLRAVDTPMRDSWLIHLVGMEKLESVRLSKRSIKDLILHQEDGNDTNSEFKLKKSEGMQIVGKIKFLVL